MFLNLLQCVAGLISILLDKQLFQALAKNALHTWKSQLRKCMYFGGGGRRDKLLKFQPLTINDIMSPFLKKMT